MKKLRAMNKTELCVEYYNTFGINMAHEDSKLLIAALYYGKPITCLTQEEINQIDEL